MNKNLMKVSLLALSSLFFSCYSGGGFSNGGVFSSTSNIMSDLRMDKLEITVADKSTFRMLVNNPWDHQLEYRYVASRGQIIANGGVGPTGQYYAPFTGGKDTITVSIYDRTDNKNLQTITKDVTIIGDSISYVDLPSTASQLNDFDNGLIKVSSVNGLSKKKEIAWGRNPTISPDGRYIAYVSYQGDGTSQIFIKDPIGNETNLTNSRAFNIDPAWSPIGPDQNSYIVFSSDRISSNSGSITDGGHGQNYHLWRMNINGYDLKQLTNTAGNDFQPNWSPDGKNIVFSSTLDNNRSNPFRNLWILDVQTGRQIQTTHETIANKGAFNPVWSFDGKQILYSRKYQSRQGNRLADMQKIWMVNSNIGTEGFGNIVTKNNDENIIESFPSWAPDGRRISFVRNKGAENGVYSVELGSIIQGSGYTGGAYTQATQEGDMNNITEASWSRQRNYGYYGSGQNNNNPWDNTPNNNNNNYNGGFRVPNPTASTDTNTRY